MNMKRLVFLFLFAGLASANADPLITSWLTSVSSKYARIYTSTANRTAGTSATTWSSGTLSQSSPAYAGVNEIDASTSYVYIRSTGLGAHVMGPWSNPNVPKNLQDLWRFPRTPAVPATNRTSSSASPTTATSLGEMGFMVDGVAAYNTSDGFSYSNTHAEDASPTTSIGNGDGIWNRDAFVNEFVSFDNALAHSQQNGEYHYHVNPVATRYLLGDNIIYNSSAKTYSENTSTTSFAHSPILAWMKDGLPLYGPYGYDGGGTGATATASISGGSVSSIAVTNAGTYTSTPAVTFSSGSATATTSMKVVSATVQTSANSSAGGTGYKVGDVLTVAGGTSTVPATLTVTGITGSGSGPIATLSITQAGSYSVVPPNYVSVTGGSGTNAELTLLWGVTAVNVTSGGSGYSSAPTVTIGGVRRMISGYQLRDGTNSTTNLNSTGRTTLPGWALTVQGRTSQITSSQYGPSVSTTYTLGHYAEDYDYLGDLGYTQGSLANSGGAFFDLDVYNTRFCVTPDYPNGTWAYFTTITSSGTSFFPYSVGRWYKGNPNSGGGSTTSGTMTSDGAVNQFLGGANTALSIGTPAVTSGTVTLTWNSVEGGTYSVADSTNDSTWTTKKTGLTPTSNGNVPIAPTVGNSTVTTTTNYAVTASSGTEYSQVNRTALATYDSAGQTSATVAQSSTASFQLSSNISTLSNLALSSGTLSPTFASGTTTYTASVSNATSSITVTPTTTNSSATVKVNGTTVASGNPSGAIALNVGDNTVTTVVTAQDGVTTTTYTITVHRKSADATLSALALSSVTLNPSFSSSTTNYTGSVPYTTTSTTITATANNAFAAVSGTGAQSLATSANTLNVLVTAEDGNSQTYSVVVTRATASTNSSLSSLVLSSGTLSPAFASGTTSYTGTVSNTTSSITVTPTVADSTATVTVNGTSVNSGSPSGGITLNTGNNTITTVVTAQNGVTTTTYTVVVTVTPVVPATPPLALALQAVLLWLVAVPFIRGNRRLTLKGR